MLAVRRFELSRQTSAVLLCALAFFFVFGAGYSALNTISRLDAVEAERDQWQRPSDVVQALDLRPGNVVVDLGCGSGYFTLKLSSSVGSRWPRYCRGYPQVSIGFPLVQDNAETQRHHRSWRTK